MIDNLVGIVSIIYLLLLAYIGIDLVWGKKWR